MNKPSFPLLFSTDNEFNSLAFVLKIESSLVYDLIKFTHKQSGLLQQIEHYTGTIKVKDISYLKQYLFAREKDLDEKYKQKRIKLIFEMRECYFIKKEMDFNVNILRQ